MTGHEPWFDAQTHVAWRVFWRRDDDAIWLEWGGATTEAEAREWLAHVRKEYPHYQIELRKITTTTERESPTSHSQESSS